MKQYQLDIEKESLGFVYEKESDKMSEKKMRIGMILGFAAGFTGGCLGIGGAILLVPAWLNSGIDKNMATSSSGPLIFCSAFISATLAFMCKFYDSLI